MAGCELVPAVLDGPVMGQEWWTMISLNFNDVGILDLFHKLCATKIHVKFVMILLYLCHLN